jgi:hypothetical protein
MTRKMESSAVKSLKLPAFDGKKDEFQIWWTRFTVHASVVRFREALIIGGKNNVSNGTFLVVLITLSLCHHSPHAA